MEIRHEQRGRKSCYEVQIGRVYIGFSYNTPISLCDMNDGGEWLMTDEHYSRTTNRHMRLLISAATPVEQKELEYRIEIALAKQAMRTLRERLIYGSASTGSPD